MRGREEDPPASPAGRFAEVARLLASSADPEAVVRAAVESPGAFTPADEELLRLHADQAAVALHNACLLAETRQLRADEAARARRAELFAGVLGAVAAAL